MITTHKKDANYKFASGPMKGQWLGDKGLSWEIGTVAGRRVAVFSDGTWTDFYIEGEKFKCDPAATISFEGTASNASAPVTVNLTTQREAQRFTQKAPRRLKLSPVEMTPEQLEAAYPHIYGPYSENLAQRTWFERLFHLWPGLEDAARDDEWKRRARAADLLKLPIPPPPNGISFR